MLSELSSRVFAASEIANRTPSKRATPWAVPNQR